MRTTQRAAKSGVFVLVLAGLGGAVLHSLPEPADHAVRPTVERDLDEEFSRFGRVEKVVIVYDQRVSLMLVVCALDLR